MPASWIDLPATMRLHSRIAINDADQSFLSDVFLRVQWSDPRLAHSHEGSCTTSLDDIWHPNLQTLNRGSVERVNQPAVEVSPDGRVLNVAPGFTPGSSCCRCCLW